MSESTSKLSANLTPSSTPSQPSPSIKYTTDSGFNITLIFHNLGSYLPTQLETNVSGNGVDIATVNTSELSIQLDN
jgi:hypothetical protein